MKRRLSILLIIATAMMLFPFISACAGITEGLIYDEADNTWVSGDKDLAELAGIMKRECAKSPLIKGTYIYLIQLHPTVAGDQYSNECMLEILRAVLK